MRYVIVRASHPSWLVTQLPVEVAEMLGYHPSDAANGPESRSVSFLARGPGVLRVVATYPAREALAIESLNGRWIASAQPGDRFMFSLPVAVYKYLGLTVIPRGAHPARGTDDTIVWFVPEDEYYDFRAAGSGSRRAGTAKERPGLAHVYLAKSLFGDLPFWEGLAERERRIETDEWGPAIQALRKVGRSDRLAAVPARGRLAGR